jgi:hypothetical protein
MPEREGKLAPFAPSEPMNPLRWLGAEVESLGTIFFSVVFEIPRVFFDHANSLVEPMVRSGWALPGRRGVGLVVLKVVGRSSHRRIPLFGILFADITCWSRPDAAPDHNGCAASKALHECVTGSAAGGSTDARSSFLRGAPLLVTSRFLPRALGRYLCSLRCGASAGPMLYSAPRVRVTAGPATLGRCRKVSRDGRFTSAVSEARRNSRREGARPRTRRTPSGSTRYASGRPAQQKHP